MALAAEQLVEQLLPTPEIPLSNPIWTCYVNLEYWKEAVNCTSITLYKDTGRNLIFMFIRQIENDSVEK